MNDWFEAEQHVERAHKHFEAGRWSEAESELRAAIARNPYQAEWHFNLGLTLEAAGRYRDAATAFRSADELAESEEPQAALLVGVNLLRSGELREAIGWFERAEKLGPESAEPFVHRIEAYARLGEHEQAEVMFYMAQQLEPENADAFAMLADSLLDRRLHDRAIWCLREANRLDPELPGVQGRLASVFADTGRHERARQLYLLELRRNPGDVETLIDLGYLLIEMSRLEEAGEKFRRVLELEPDNADAHFYLGELAERQGRFEDADAQYEIVRRLDANYPGVRRRQARLLLENGRESGVASARRALRREIREVRRDAPAYGERELRELCELLLDAGLAREAIPVLDALNAQVAEDAQITNLRSVAAFEAGDIDRGGELARRAVRLDRRQVAPMHNLALMHMRRGEWMRARYWVLRARHVDPDDASLRRLKFMLVLHAGVVSLRRVAGWLFRRRIAAT